MSWRVLFVGETVTLAHGARPLVLASSVARDDRFAVAVALDCHFDAALFGGSRKQHEENHRCQLLKIASQSPRVFSQRLQRGAALLDVETLRDHVRDDIALLESWRPDVVIGDMRLSLGISAKVLGIPYVNITNAHWYPTYKGGYPLPDLPFNRVLGLGLSQLLFGLFRPAAFAQHVRPANRVAREFGVEGWGLDLRRFYAAGDVVLLADARELFDAQVIPDHCHFLGPIRWAPSVDVPALSSISRERPWVYWNLGSSGVRDHRATAVHALRGLALEVIVGGLSAASVKAIAATNFHEFGMLPGDRVARASRVVICNGGSASVYQALTEGVPVLGIVSNLDQHLTMRAVTALGAGRVLRSEALTADDLRTTTLSLLDDAHALRTARELAVAMGQYDPGATCVSVLEGLLGPVKSMVAA